jgi:hypothetical protein
MGMSGRRQTSKADDLIEPGGARELLLLACCAPCSGEPLRALGHEGLRAVVYFYNPNIHPREQYERRRDCIRDHCRRLGVEFVEGPYDPERWFTRTAGMEAEPQRGRRCAECFRLRLERAAEFARRKGLTVLACTLGISRWKDLAQVDAAGLAAAAGVAGVQYWPRNWRKAGGSRRMYEIARAEFFYMQDYCGCVFSKADRRDGPAVGEDGGGAGSPSAPRGTQRSFEYE